MQYVATKHIFCTLNNEHTYMLILIMECYLNRLLKLFKIVLGPYRIRSSCNHPAARITPLRRSPTIFPYNFDSPKVFSHRFAQISSGLSTDDRSMFVPGIVLFSFSEMKE